MKKIFFTFIVLLTFNAFGADNVYLKALEDFNSENPSENFKAEVLEDAQMNGLFVLKGDILNCTLIKTKDPKRAKLNAKAYFSIVSYEDSKGIHKIMQDLTGKYAKSVINKEKIKEIEPKKVVKTTAGVVGNYFLQGISYGISFVDGLITNDEGNRLKSGIKQVYDDSFLSYIEYGDIIDIKKGDTFYFIVKPTSERDLEKINKKNEELTQKENDKISS